MDLTTNPTQYSFPLLKNEEIIQCLSEVGIEMNSNELTEPNKHKDKVRSTFFSLVSSSNFIVSSHSSSFHGFILDFSHDRYMLIFDSHVFLLQLRVTSGQPSESNDSVMSSLSPTVHSKLANLEFPNLHEESLQNLKFLKSAMRLMHICGVHDFGLIDLTSPSYKRLRRQLSAVINFIKFREERLVLYAELQDGREELYTGLMEVEYERKVLEEQLEATKQNADKRWEEAQLCHNDEEELENKIAQQNKVQRAIRNESSELKKKASVLKDQIDMADLGLQEMESEEKKLLAQVIPPPDQLKAEMKDIALVLKQEKNRCKEAEEDARISGIRTTNVFNAKRDLIQAIKLIDKLARDEKKYNEAQGEYEEQNRINEANDKEMKRLQETRDEHERALSGIISQIEESKITAKEKLEELQSSIQYASGELLSLEKDGRHAKERIEREELEMNIIKKRIEDENSKAEHEIADIVTTIQKLESKFIEHADRLNTELCAH